MPTSDHHNINSILSVVTALRPKRILDVGCGFGKYGVLMREYLDVWDERLNPADWRIHLEELRAVATTRAPFWTTSTTK